MQVGFGILFIVVAPWAFRVEQPKESYDGS